MPGAAPEAGPPAALLRAYRQAIYRIGAAAGDPAAAPLTFRIDEDDPALTRLLRQHGVDRGAFVTAHNPGSRRLPDTVNQAAQRALEQAVDEAGWPWLPGLALDPAGHWPAEPSLAVLGIGRAAACSLAARFGQNALVWLAAGAGPALVWVGDTPPRPVRAPGSD